MSSPYSDVADVQSRTVSARDVWKLISRSKWYVLFTIALFTSLAGIAGSLVPMSYEANVVLAPAGDAGRGGLGGLQGLASELGGIASLAGVSLDSDSKKWEALAVLQSDRLLQTYIRDNDLLRVLYERRWDAETKEWTNLSPKRMPTVWKGAQLFKKKILRVTPDGKTGLVTVSVKWTNPELASKWANDLVRITNQAQRERAIAESDRNVSYLQSQASKTDVVGVRDAIYSILEGEIKRGMLAKGSEEYALKVLDPASVPEKPISLPVFIWMLLGMLGGTFVAFAGVILKATASG